MSSQASRASLFVLAVALTLPVCTLAQEKFNCGQVGKSCCCEATFLQSPDCCTAGLQCVLFGGRGFGTPAATQTLCAPKASQACGSEDGPCCLTSSSSGFVAGTCATGLSCKPGPNAYGSRAQFSKLSQDGTAATADTAVVGTCSKAAACSTAYGPCGKAAGCGGAACPSGFYCAASIDSGVGDVCIPLPRNAGQTGGPCLPNNLQAAPLVAAQSLRGQQVAAPFCSGSAVCFTPVGGDATGFNLNKGPGAKDLATRITGTLCVDVPTDCGSGVGAPCCPSSANMVTDKPLPAAAWGGEACNPEAGPYGSYCQGSYAALGGQPMGTCVANEACGGPNQPCCRYSRANMAGLECPRLGRPGAGYCGLANTCTLCPKVAYTVDEILRCY